ncbi:MAG: hypothetical protein JRG81_10345 [Deltaproteobacteria bacterium]|nr:hypothetical protein [Deltaproteobacteria bacterium]
MKKMSVLHRLLLSITGLLAAYQIVAGMKAYNGPVTFYYTIAFDVLLMSCVLLILFDFEILDNPMVVVIATLLPLSLFLGLISRHRPDFHTICLIFSLAGLLLILGTRYYFAGKIATIVLAIVHGVSGMVIFILPISISIQGTAPPLFSFVGIGGALIGVGGLLLAFLKMGKPILSKELIFSVFPSLLLLMTLAFVIGMSVEA